MDERIKTYKDADQTILKSILNSTKEGYEIKIKIPEFTFLGANNQPAPAALLYSRLSRAMQVPHLTYSQNYSRESCETITAPGRSNEKILKARERD